MMFIFGTPKREVVREPQPLKFTLMSLEWTKEFWLEIAGEIRYTFVSNLPTPEFLEALSQKLKDEDED